MARSNKVLAVVGMLCVNRKYRASFFEQPETWAVRLVGELNADELAQVNRLAGELLGVAKSTYQLTLAPAFDGVHMALGCNNTCPTPPCPCPDNDDVNSAA